MGRVVAWFAGNGKEGDGGRGRTAEGLDRRVVVQAACVLASDYSKTLGSLRWLVSFSLSIFLMVFYPSTRSFRGGFPYAGGLEFPTGSEIVYGRFLSVSAFLLLALDYYN